METFAEPVFSNDLLAKAESGDTSAQLELAEIYLYGHGVDSDENQAEIWAIKSAENGNVAAMFWLADGYVTYAMIYAELSGDFPLGDSRQPIYKSLRP
ncbi:sel1 repeat family protein, partial [Acinetobacter baumannii]